MKPRLKSTSAARELIKAHVNFAANAHQNGDGSWVVGYGHHASAKAGVSVSPDDAELLLVYDMLQAEKAIDETIGADIGTSQRDALVSFALGIGLAAFRRSAVVRLIRKQRWHEAADAIAAWDGGGVPRHDAERTLFLKDLPEDADHAPVELIIEFDHPSDDDAAADAPEAEAEEKAGIHEDAAAETSEDSPAIGEMPTAPEAPDPVRLMPGRSELAERIILRMRNQLAGADHENGSAPGPDAGDAPGPAREPVSAETVSGVLGFAYTQSVSIGGDAPLSGPTGMDDAPPVVGIASASADGIAGEVSGTGDASAEIPSADDDAALLAPSDIDAEFAEDSRDGHGMDGWSNGETTPAPGKNGGHLGEIILLVLGVALLAGGIWDLLSRPADEASASSLFFGLSALVAGFIFAAGAAIWLFGSKKK